jgi:4a-hydroxytetrahydrobiopterin dehydratase
MSDLASQRCEPCRGNVPPIPAEEQSALLTQLDSDWTIVDGHHLERTYRFVNFRDALAFVNAAGAIAEEQAHHPDLHLAWGRVRVEIWTHKIDGLHTADFVLAAKLDQIERPTKRA